MAAEKVVVQTLVAEHNSMMLEKVKVQVTSGPIKGAEFVFDAHDALLFGRHGTCHAQIVGDGFVSRHHFILEVNPPDARLRDLGSLSGTYVNGTKFGGRGPNEAREEAARRQSSTVDLSDGDIITVGKTTLRVNIESVPRAGNPTDNRPRTVRETPTCELCGRDVSGEVGNRGEGKYTCEKCRTELLSDSGGIRQLMQGAAARVIQRDRPPVIAGYDLGDVLGRGGMGIVYRAKRTSDGQSVAIKVMLPSVGVGDTARRAFQREIDVISELEHPNILKLHDHGHCKNVFYFVCDFCEGGSLDHLMKRNSGTVAVKTAARIMDQCLQGLVYAHGRNFVHRDLKPQNILLFRNGRKWLVKLADFGLAKSFATAGLSGMTATSSIGGTFHFMPREQLTEFKYVRPVSDLWSLAATLYNILTGHYPRDMTVDRDHLEVVLNDHAIPIRNRGVEIPARFADVIDRALLMDPADRFQTATEFREALLKAL